MTDNDNDPSSEFQQALLAKGVPEEIVRAIVAMGKVTIQQLSELKARISVLEALVLRGAGSSTNSLADDLRDLRTEIDAKLKKPLD